MNIKQVLAMEWLYLLGFAGFAGLVAVVSLFVVMPQPVENVRHSETQFSNQDMANIRKNLDSAQRQSFDSLVTLGQVLRAAVEKERAYISRGGQSVLDSLSVWPVVFEKYQKILETL